MKVFDKIIAKNKDIYAEAPVTLVFLGDSVTQGCFEVYYDENGCVQTVYENEQSFSSKLKKILHYLCPSAQINIINSGLSGDSAENGNKRFERDVTPFSPDLVVVGFALNDCMQGEEGKDRYVASLKEIFNKVKALGAECIFLTPNLMNDTISPHINDDRIKELALHFSKHNRLNEYVKIAKVVAREEGVAVCDVYEKWQILREKGVNTTELLSNKLNHPTREMGWLTAFLLAQTIIS